MAELSIVDAHVHFWDSGRLEYPWLSELPALQRAWLPVDYLQAHTGLRVESCVAVEANPRTDQGIAEVELLEALGGTAPRVAAIVAFVDLTDAIGCEAALERLCTVPRVRGIRQNVQGQPPGYCLERAFVQGVRNVGRWGLTFDLCATHDQLADVVALVRRCPETRFVLDHCGKPAIRERLLDPWRTHLAELADCPNVWCKISGLLTEAAPARREDADLLPYVEHVVERFGTGRVMYGSDWPVLTLAGSAREWYQFTERVTRDWSAEERSGFYRDNANRFYGIEQPHRSVAPADPSDPTSS